MSTRRSAQLDCAFTVMFASALAGCRGAHLHHPRWLSFEPMTTVLASVRASPLVAAPDLLRAQPREFVHDQLELAVPTTLYQHWRELEPC